MSNLDSQFTIIGGGIAGLTTALALQQVGIKAEVFEAAPEIKGIGAGLGLAANAIKALDKLGLGPQVRQRARQFPTFTIYDPAGRIITQTDSTQLSQKYGADNFIMHRAALHQLLLEKAHLHHLHLNKRAIALELKQEGVSIRFHDGSIHRTAYLIVADGIHSTLRQQLLPGTIPRYAGYTCWRAVIHQASLELTGTSETWGPAGRFGIGPLTGNQVYWYACINTPPDNPVFRNYRVANLFRHFRHYHAPIPTILQQTRDEDLLWNDIHDLKPLPRYAFGRVLLTGDAAHATTPNLGQGACQAIEDALVLAEELGVPGSVPAAFQRFEQRRLKRTRQIVRMSRQVGQIAQISSPPVAALRNFCARLLPAAFHNRQFRFLYEVDF